MNSETKSLIDKGLSLPLMEAFYTIQGEGSHTGKAAYFIRIGGCDVGCHWCDVKESWDSKTHPPTLTESIVIEAAKLAKTVVVTGGEPSMWQLDYLCDQLHEKGIKVHIETSGAYELTGTWDWICLSPKKTKLPVDSIYPKAEDVQRIIHNKRDFKFAEEQASNFGPNCLLYLQPEWSKKEKVTPEIIDYVMKHPKWNISLQTHKYLNIP